MQRPRVRCSPGRPSLEHVRGGFLVHRGTSEHSHARDASFRQLRGSSRGRACSGTEDSIWVAVLPAFCQHVYKDEVSYSLLCSMTKLRSGAFHLVARSIWISLSEDSWSSTLCAHWRLSFAPRELTGRFDHSRSCDATVRKHSWSPPALGSMSTLGFRHVSLSTPRV